MCLVLLALDETREYPVQLAANRDEYHARAADPLHWWPDRHGILAGRDQRAGGTWLGASDAGRFATVLNDRRVEAPPDAPSRGHLVPDFLEAPAPEEWLDRLADRRADYAGFHFLAGAGVRAGAGAGRRVAYCASGVAASLMLGAGLHVIDNGGLDVDDARTRRARAGVGQLMRAGADSAALLDALADTSSPVAARGGGDSGGADSDSSDRRPVFIRHPVFGTRCSTLLRLDRNGRMSCHERRFDADGRCLETSSETWSLSASATSCAC